MEDKRKVAVITGAARGIGRAIALKFASCGVDIVLNYKTTNPDELITQIESYGVSCLAFGGDISDYNTAGELIKAAKERFGSIDYLINNAGITKDKLILRMDVNDFDDVISTNLKGAFNTISHISPIMVKQRCGSIVNVSSVAGVYGNAGQANYSAAKAGLIGLTKAVSRELGSRNITVNAVAPGAIETDMTKNLPESVKKRLLDRIPLNRYGKDWEVADAVYFVATCGYMTGQVLIIDGGM